MAQPTTYILSHTGRDASTSVTIRGKDNYVTVGSTNHADIVVKGSDAAPALQAAFDNTDGGVKLYPEDFTISSAGLTISRNIWVEALRPSKSGATRINNTSSDPAITITGTAGTHLNFVKLSGFAITGANSADNSDHGIVLKYVNDWVLQDLWIANHNGSGISFDTDCWRGEVVNCLVELNQGHGALIASTANANRIYVRGGSLSRNLKSGLSITSGGYNLFHVAGMTIEGNTFFGISLNGGYSPVIVGNYFETNRGTGGIEADVVVGATAGQTVINPVIIDNYFSGSSPADHGILVLDAEGGLIDANYIATHDIRNIDIGTSGGGRTVTGVRCYFYESSGYIAGSASRNQGGATVFKRIDANSTTFTDQDTTPSVSGMFDNYQCSNTVATNVTTFDDGIDAQLIRVLFTTANTTLIDGATLQLAASANYNPPANTVMTFNLRGGVWYEVSRSND